MYLENRLIAMLDVLGFANRIQTPEGLISTTTKYAALIKRAQAEIFFPRAVEGSPEIPENNFALAPFVFDTIVLVSHPIDVKSVCRFISATTLLLEMFFSEEFPLRGAIGIGDFCTDDSVQIFLSDVFKQLRVDEDRQQWTGCAVLPNAEELILTSLLGPGATTRTRRSSMIQQVAIPTKQADTAEQRWCLNWSYFLAPEIIEKGIKYMSGDPAKQVNTIRYLKLVEALPDNAQLLPPEFLPAVRVKTMATRANCRFRFEDENGISVQPGCAFEMTVNAEL